MGLPHPYWTAVPTDPNPIQEGGRDGVAPVDDMALRALVPQARPKRNMKRAGEADETAAHPSSRPRSTSATTPPPPGAVRQEKNRQRRHGAKVVSSAWRSRGLGGAGGRVRGRPPVNPPASTNGSFSRFPAVDTSSRDRVAGSNSGGFTPAAPPAPVPVTTAPILPPPATQVPSQLSRPAGPIISAQGPNGVGQSVPVAAPPQSASPHPNATTNGRPYPAQNANTTEPPLVLPNLAPPVDLPQYVRRHPDAAQPVRETNGANATNRSDDTPPRGPTGFMAAMKDRTNIDTVFNFFVKETIRADWSDAGGNPLPPCSVGLAQAITQSTFEALLEAAPSREAFLINLGALSGAKLLMTTTKLKMRRMAEYSDRTLFTCSWEYQLGDIRGQYQMTQTVLHDQWRGAQNAEPTGTRPEQQDNVNEEEGEKEGGSNSPNNCQADGEGAEAVDWKAKYESLLREVQAKDRQLEALKATIWGR